MQGQNSAISSLPETFNFKHGSTSSSAGIDQHPCSNDIRPPAQGQLPECLLSTDDTRLRFVDSASMEQQDIRSWSLGNTPSATESGTSSREVKTDNGWLSPMTLCPSAGSRFEERWPEQNPFFVQDVNSNAMHPDINLNLSGDIGNSHLVMGHSSLCKSSGLENELALPASSSSSLPRSSGDAASSMLQSDGQLDSPFLPLRASCKRKAPEENADQPSSSTSHMYVGQADSGSWPGSSVQLSQGFRISAPSDHVNPSLELGARVPAFNRMPEPTQRASIQTSHTPRNVRARINTSSHGESTTPLISSDTTGRHFAGTSLPWLSRSIPFDHSLNLMTGSMADNASAQSQNMAGIHVPALPGNMQALRLNASSEAGPAALSRPSDATGVSLQQRPRRTARNTSDRSLFVPRAELRQPNQSPSNGLNNVPANDAAFSQHWSSSGANVSPSPSMVSRSHPHRQYSQRFSELVRRSLLASAGAESGGPNSIQASLPPGAHASPGDMVFPSVVVNQGLPRLHPRSVPVLERRGNRVIGFPPSRTLAAASEGRNRLVVSEHIRNVLELMRRGQNLRFEDVVFLDQSVFYGIADIHDRHRDMRLDVDNMSYEELLALEERIGNVCTGLDEDSIFKRLKRHKYGITPGVQVEAEPCCICQEEYNDGEELGMLECGHDFHTHCIKQWLVQKNLCPICKTTGLMK